MATKKSLVVKQPQALEPWEENLAGEAKEARAKETLGIPRISHKGGVLQIDGKKLENNELIVAVVGYIFVKSYYEGEYNPAKVETPVCYAFGTEEKGMIAHEQSPKKQNPQADGTSPCGSCQWNVFGTADKGRGKACKDERRLLVIAPPLARAGEMNTSEEAFARAEARQISIPPGSLKGWGAYLASLPDLVPQGHYSEAFLKIKPEAQPTGAYKLNFSFAGAVPRPIVKALAEKRKSAYSILATPFPNIASEEEAPPARKGAAGKGKGKPKF